MSSSSPVQSVTPCSRGPNCPPAYSTFLGCLDMTSGSTRQKPHFTSHPLLYILPLLLHLLDVRVLWDFQQLHLLLLCLGDEGIFDVICSAAAEWHRNDLRGGGGEADRSEKFFVQVPERSCLLHSP